jgi:hypothetical protein
MTQLHRSSAFSKKVGRYNVFLKKSSMTIYLESTCIFFYNTLLWDIFYMETGPTKYMMHQNDSNNLAEAETFESIDRQD